MQTLKLNNVFFLWINEYSKSKFNTKIRKLYLTRTYEILTLKFVNIRTYENGG